MLRQKRCTLLQFSGGQQLIDPAVHRNQAARIVVAAVYQHHAHSQFPNHPLVKRLQSPILVETYEQAVELQIELHCACPIAVTHGALIAFQCLLQFRKSFNLRGARSENGRDLQHAPQRVNFLNIGGG